MTALLLSILCSSLIMMVFLFFKKYKIGTFHAIVVNYLTAVLLGIPFVRNWEVVSNSYTNWYLYALILGSIFISLFFLIGKTTQQLGVSVTTVSMKLGYVIPIFFAVTIYKEQINTLQWLAIIITVLAVVLSSIKSNKDNIEIGSNKFLLFLPLLIFVGSGVSDAIVQFTEKTFFQQEGFEAFLIILFATAGGLGLNAALIHDFKKKENNFTKKNILAGVLLGIPNYGSIYFLFKALNAFPGNSAAVFPLNNVGVVVVSTLIAFTLFKEKMNKINVVGFTLAVISIILMSFDQLKNIF